MRKEIVSLNSLEKNFKKEMSLEERFEILNQSTQNAIRGGLPYYCPQDGEGGGGGCAYTPPCTSNCPSNCSQNCHLTDGGCIVWPTGTHDPCNGIWTIPCTNFSTPWPPCTPWS